jgi:dihydrofolate synthase / folylpolyglutamate synthase
MLLKGKWRGNNRMTYDEALKFIHSTRKLGWKLGLDNMRNLLELMGNPHKRLKYVHIAGTNGKGSTAAMISSILMEAGYNTGLYTSPYIVNFNERMQVNGKEISNEKLASITEYVKENIDIIVDRGDSHPTEFEIVTAIAFQYFFDMKCDVVVLEVGMGGRFDSTNIIDPPLAAVITSISFDHMQYLGDTLEKIAFEKAGIIKNETDVILYPQVDGVRKVVEQSCLNTGSVLHEVDFGSLSVTHYDENGQVFSFDKYKDLKISLIGDHQAKNAAVAIKTVEMLRSKGLNISDELIYKGLKNARWPGRFEIIKKNPLFIIDGAHNAEKIEALRSTLVKYFPGKSFTFIIGVLEDKDYKEMFKAIAVMADRIITVTPLSERALPAKELAQLLKLYCKNVSSSDTIEEAIRTSIEASYPHGVICAFGSLYLIGEIRNAVAISV